MRQEIEVRDIIPAIRREYAKAFVSIGFSQRKTAKILNLTEAAVSNYIHDRRGSSVPLPKYVIVKIVPPPTENLKVRELLKELDKNAKYNPRENLNL